MPAPLTGDPDSDYARCLRIKHRKKKRKKKEAKRRALEAHTAQMRIAAALELIAAKMPYSNYGGTGCGQVLPPGGYGGRG